VKVFLGNNNNNKGNLEEVILGVISVVVNWSNVLGELVVIINFFGRNLLRL